MRTSLSRPAGNLPLQPVFGSIPARRRFRIRQRKDFQIDPSQGMHFFSNIVSAGRGYFTVSFESPENQYINWNWLDAQKAVRETEYVKHVYLTNPLEVLIDGKTSTGCILKPDD